LSRTISRPSVAAPGVATLEPAAPDPDGGRGRGRAGVVAGVVVLCLVLVGLGALAWTRRASTTVAAGTGSTAGREGGAGPATTAAPTTTRAPATTSTVASAPDPGGTPFDDPEGTYRLKLSPAWRSVDSGVPGVEAWLTGATDGDFRDNVNISTEVAVGIRDADAGLRRVREQIEEQAKGAVTIEDATFVTSTSGQRVGRLTVTNIIGAKQARQQAYVVVGPAQLVILTVSVLPSRSDALFRTVEPYALTLTASDLK
jgi:hypothetical protein